MIGSRRLVAGLVLLALTACALDPRGSIAIEGIVLDVDRRPVSGATVSILVDDTPLEFLDLTVTTGPDGRFSIPLAPTPELRAVAAERGGDVDFGLSAIMPDGSLGGSWLFSRTPTETGWAGAIPRVILSREGSEVEP